MNGLMLRKLLRTRGSKRMTELLHMRDNYLQEFDAKVLAKGEDYVVLDRTAFYPEGGGQSSDIGKLSDDSRFVEVKEVRKIDGGTRHILKGRPFEIGTKIHGIIDWDYRYECMRFHTAQHVLSRYLQLNYNVETVGNNISPGESRADYSPLESFDEDMKREVESGVNEILHQNLPVDIKFMPRAEAIRFLENRGYQTRYLEMVPKSVKEFRVLVIGDYDAASCAGTHVKNTREIGGIKIGKSKNVGAGKRRIYFRLVNP
ncbi:alanyl-tRNA editing protein [Candidatus Thorarchaeota archaeon]|nr:MAG: alanyl-tRNA editing protein [Candidatus Thorarchaeota archaeon]